MNLLPTVGINLTSLGEYLEVSAKTVRANELPSHVSALLKEYQDDALVPEPRWEKVDPDWASLMRPPDSEKADCVGLIKFSAYDFQTLRRFVASFRGSKDTPAAVQLLKQTIRNYLTIDGGFEVLGVFASEAKLYTVTRNKAKEFIGLHVDNWDNRSISTRTESRSRICVNLGPGHRYFLFSPVRFIDASVEGGVNPDLFSAATELGRTFLKNNPETPIFRLKLEPGFAYLAPTESTIHDGSTIDSTEASDTLVCFGKFGRRTAASFVQR